jgi:hypothetical protein
VAAWRPGTGPTWRPGAGTAVVAGAALAPGSRVEAPWASEEHRRPVSTGRHAVPVMRRSPPPSGTARWTIRRSGRRWSPQPATKRVGATGRLDPFGDNELGPP